MAPPHTNKKISKEKSRERRKEKQRSQPDFTEKEVIRRAVNHLANRKRQALQKVLEGDDKMGLSKEGAQQLKDLLAKKAPTGGRPSMADLEPSAMKVLDQLLKEKDSKAEQAGEGEQIPGLGDDVGEETEEEMEDDDEGDYMVPEPVTP